MTEVLPLKGSKFPTLMRHYETDEDLDNYVIAHAYMFTVIQIRPGGFVNGFGSNYIREEVHVKDHGGNQAIALEAAWVRAAEIYAEKKKTILIYAVADFAGAIGFNRPVRQYPASNYRSKSDKARDERKAIALRKAERGLAREHAGKTKELKPVVKKPEFKAAVFKTTFEEAPGGITEEEFLATDKPMARLIRD